MTDLATERAALLVLLKRSKGGWGVIARRVLAASSALAVAEEDGMLSPTLFEEDPWDSEVAAALEAEQRWIADGLRLVTVLDADYPLALLAVAQQPPFVFLRGIRDETDHQGIAVVGSRRATDASLAAATRIARELVESGRVVVSGLAAGIDAAAHTAALAAGGRTVAVIGTGLKRNYPAKNAELQRQVGERGLIVSQFWPDSPPTKISFPMRNEVMSAWACATLVIQADFKSGARLQARIALQQGRTLYLYEGLKSEDWACEYANLGKATFISGVADLALLT